VFLKMMTPEEVAAAALSTSEDFTMRMQTWEKSRGKTTYGEWIVQQSGEMVMRHIPKPINVSSMTQVIKRVRRKGGLLWCAAITPDQYEKQIGPLIDEFEKVVVSGLVVNTSAGARCFLMVSASGADAVVFRLTYEGQDRTPV
jgi:hypothetical protein